MAKTIKFNLICDGKPVRTIEDLQNNFSIEDILNYYDNKLLHRWLRVRGYEKELEAVDAIIRQDSLDIIKELIKIFDIESDEEKVKESIYLLQYQKENKALNSIYVKEKYQVQQIINDYENGYRQLVADIIEHSNDIARIKAAIAEITSNYEWVLELDYRKLFIELKDVSALAIMCLLMNEKSRKYYLPMKKTQEDGSVTYDTIKDRDKQWMFNLICSMIKKEEFREKLGKHLLSFAGITDGYWKDLEPKGKRYMIISMESGNYVRASGCSGGDLSQNDISNRFVILDGIDYKSNSNFHKLFYMEV